MIHEVITLIARANIKTQKITSMVGFSTLFALQNNIVKLWRETLEATALTVAFENAVLENPAFLRLNHPQNRVLSCCWRPLWCQQSSLLSNVETFSQTGQDVQEARGSGRVLLGVAYRPTKRLSCRKSTKCIVSEGIEEILRLGQYGQDSSEPQVKIDVADKIFTFRVYPSESGWTWCL